MYKRQVERGTLHVSDEVEIVGIKEETRKVVVTGIEMFRKLLDEAQALSLIHIFRSIRFFGESQ